MEIFTLLSEKAHFFPTAQERWTSVTRLDRKYVSIGKKYRQWRRGQENGSQTSGDSADSRRLPVYEGGEGGGLDMYMEIETDLKEFGSIRHDKKHDFRTPVKIETIEGPEQDEHLDDVVDADGPHELQTPAAADSTPETSKFTALNTRGPAPNAATPGDGVRISEVRNSTGYSEGQRGLNHTSSPPQGAPRDYSLMRPYVPTSPSAEPMYFSHQYVPNTNESAQRDTLSMHPDQPALDGIIYSPPQQNAVWYPTPGRPNYYPQFDFQGGLIPSLNAAGDIPAFQTGESYQNTNGYQPHYFHPG